MKTLKNHILLSTLFFIASHPLHAHADDAYVAKDGNDSADGKTINTPYATIKHALRNAKPGDTIIVRGGRYHEEIKLDEIAGDEGKPITLTRYKDETVTLDGSEAITDIAAPGATWERHKGNIYRIKVAKPVWQLWVDGRMAIVARWPNVTRGHPCDEILLKDDNVTPVENSWWHIRSTWGHMKSAWNKEGRLENDPSFHDMAKEKVSFAGGSIILNFHSESQFSRNILSHKAGSNELIHEEVFNPHDKGSGYFLIEHLNALDSPGEWYYDKDSGHVYLWCEDGKSPEGRKVRGKTISYALEIARIRHFTLDGIDFFGCTIHSPDGIHLTIENCRFSYPSWFRRMLGEHTYNIGGKLSKDKDGKVIRDGREARPEPMGVGGTFFLAADTKAPAHFTMRNCVWEYSDSLIQITGHNNLVENNLFHHWSFTGMASMVLMMNGNKNSLITRNTFHTNGSKAMVKHSFCDVSWCRASHFGYFQQDGVAYQCSGGNFEGGGSDGRIRERLWHHQAFKPATRWDGHNGVNGTDRYVVSWNVPSSLMVKGDRHFVYNNTAVRAHDYTENMIKVLQEDGDKKMGQRNRTTRTYNNLADSISSIRHHFKELIGKDHGNNWNGYLKDRDKGVTADLQLRDVDNLDFRPDHGAEIIDAGKPIPGVTDGYVGKAPDIGAYEYGCENYWIPGYQAKKASTAIPPDGARAARPDCDLMWLPGRNAREHKIYFGTQRDDLRLMSTQKNNVFDPTPEKDGALELGRTYYWRVDTITEARIVPGDVWSFTPNKKTKYRYATFTVLEDTCVDSENPDKNFSDAGQGYIASSADGKTEKEAYLKFNIIGEGSILSARLKLHRKAGGANVRGVQVWSLSDTSWDAKTMTYKNRPKIDGTLLDQKDIHADGWKEFDVTKGVRKGIVSLAVDREISKGNRSIDLSESGHAPALTVKFGPKAIPPPGNIIGTRKNDSNTLTWDPLSSPDLEGYMVMRRHNPEDNFVPLHQGVLKETTFTDDGLEKGLTYQYVVCSVDKKGKKSVQSVVVEIPAKSGTSK